MPLIKKKHYFVFWVIGVVGLISTITNIILYYQNVEKIISEVEELIIQAQNISCEYNEHYNSYGEMLAAQNLSTLKYHKGKFSGSSWVTYQFVESNRDHITLQISDLSYITCRKLVMHNWGNRSTTGFDGISIGKKAKQYSMTESYANTWCYGGRGRYRDNSIQVSFLGCNE